MRRVSIILISFVCSIALAQQNEVIAPRYVEAKVDELGAKQFVRNYYGSKEWGALFYGVASGDKAWLKLVKKVMEGTDAGATSELRDAVAWALPKAPKEVLLLSNEVFTLNSTCFGPPVDEPPGGMVPYIKASIEAVSKITDPELLKMKESCLEQLRTTEARYVN